MLYLTYSVVKSDSNVAFTFDKSNFPYTFSDCSTVAAGCFCSKQGSDACDLLSNSLCNADSNACECDMSAFREEGGVCVDAYSYTSDGSSVYPFVDSPTSTTYFYPVEGTDTNKFDVEANGFFLEASGTVSKRKYLIQPIIKSQAIEFPMKGQ